MELTKKQSGILQYITKCIQAKDLVLPRLLSGKIEV